MTAALAPIPHDVASQAILALDIYTLAAEREADDLVRLLGQIDALRARVASACVEREEAARRLVAGLQRARRPRAQMPGEDGRPVRPLRDGGDAPRRVLPAGRYP